MRKSWTSELKVVKIENFRFHKLRHTVGTRLAEQVSTCKCYKRIIRSF